MASGNVAAGKKRRADGPPPSRGAPKRRKPDILVQSGNPGEINVTNFVKAREFEIKALENNMKAMRKSLSSRAFQQLPRHMRRRTASHNVKKVPRRLRKRAIREMKDDNTPTVSKRTKKPSRKLRLRLETAKSLKQSNQRSKKLRQKKKDADGKPLHAPKKEAETDPAKQVSIVRIPKIKKNTLAKPPMATSKYKRRQVNKTWLPTHLWHAKRARMSRPTEPLWRLAIPLRPTEKSYRPTHRASSARGCVAWDMSYLSTVVCRGTEHTLENLLRALNFDLDSHVGRLRRWKAGARFAEGFVHEIDTGRLMGPALVLWTPTNVKKSDAADAVKIQKGSEDATNSSRQKVKLDRKILIRVHPSMFKDFWIQLVRAAKMQKPQVLVDDLRFEIGSIHVTGPASTEALLSVLKPRREPTEADAAVNVWTSLAGLSNPASLPARAVLSFDIVDPRLSHPTKPTRTASHQHDLNQLTNTIATWPLDESEMATKLVSHKARWLASSNLPSQQGINRRKAEAGPGKAIKVMENDPAIPVVLFAHRAASPEPNAQGSWTVLLPWCAVDAVWRSLLYYPISTGSIPRFGGLQQTKQLAFESMSPWFPADMPGTEAGRAWERTESEKRFDAWLRRPPSRRLRWDLVDIGLGRKGELGRGWACDWEFLLQDTTRELPKPTLQEKDVASTRADAEMTEAVDERSRRRNTSSPEGSPEPEAKVERSATEAEFGQLAPKEAHTLLNPWKFKYQNEDSITSTPAIATVRIRLLTKGTPEVGARIYRLPQSPKDVEAPPQASLPIPSTRQQPNQKIISSGCLPASAEVHTSTDPAASNSTPSAPPPGQRSPPSTPGDFSSMPLPIKFIPPARSLRDKWLSLIPPTFYKPTTNTKVQPISAKSHPKPHHHHDLATESHALSMINVFPPRASEELIAKFDTYPSEEQIAEFERDELLRELLKNDAVSLERDGKGVKWDATKGLVECPDKQDLIGFVTSGGFNLKEGRGTAVGGVWCQRVREGWDAEEKEMAVMELADGAAKNNGRQENGSQAGNGRAAKARPKQSSRSAAKSTPIPGKPSAAEDQWTRRRRERTFCIVRNAGSGVGRLGWWEVCQ